MQTLAFTTSLGQILLTGSPEAFRGTNVAVLIITGAFAEAEDHIRIPAFLGSGYDGFVAPLPGNRAPELTTTSIEAFAQAFDEVLDQLKRPAVVMGVSIGGVVALAMKNAKAVLALDPPLSTRKLWPLIPMLEPALETHPTFLKNVFGITSAGVEDRRYHHLLDHLAVPTQVVVGQRPLYPERDLDSFPSLVDEPERAAMASHPLITLHVAPNSGHAVTKHNPLFVMERLRDVCASVASAPESVGGSVATQAAEAERDAVDRELLAAAPITAKRVLELQADDAKLATAYARLNPTAAYTLRSSNHSESGKAYFDLIICRRLLRGAGEADLVMAQAKRELAPGGHIIVAVDRAAPQAWPGLRTLRSRPPLIVLESLVTFQVVCAEREEEPDHRPLAVHYRLLAPRSMDIRTRLPVEAMGRDPRLAISMGPAEFAASSVPKETPKIIVHQRQGVTNEVDWLRSMAMLIRQGWISVSEFDDHPGLTAAAYGNEATEETWRHFSHYHAIQTSTPRLASLFKARNPNVAVFPNAVFDLPPLAPRTGLTKIFYGAINRGPLAAQVMRSLAPVTALFPQVKFVVVGDRAVFEAAPTANKQFFDYLPYEHYLQVMERCDICLSPLEDAEGASCKSDAKFLDAARCGMVTVASPTVYAETIVHGRNGLIARAPGDWPAILLHLLRNPDRREILAKNAWSYVRERRMFAHQAVERRNWYLDLWARRDELTRQLVERAPMLSTLLS